MTNQQKEGYTLQELLQKYQVEIPMLQRDYAQGRRSSESIAKEFLNAIFEVLEGRKGTLHNDFIFGYQENNKFLLIDGQQRITTLWLLHFYLYKKSEALEDKKSLLGNFSYSVRKSSRDFCKNLLKKDFDISKKPSEAIIDAGSEFGEAENLRNDPTIKAMLHMLDLIYEKIEDKDKNSIQKLAESLNSITFELFDMGKFSLGDELYIKMNARGKQLSRYENLKAFIQKDSKISCDRELLENMDSKWTDYFFEVEKLKEFDTRGRNFLHYAALFFYFKNKDSIDEERIKKSDQPIDDFYQSLQKIENIKLLDRAIELFLCFNDLGISEKLAPQESSFFIKKDEDESEDKDKSEGLTLRKICYFFSILSFLEKNRENDFNDIKNHLNDWLRVSRHLIENHPLNKPIEHLPAFSDLFKYLSQGHDDIYQFLADHPPYKFHSNFYSLESRKAKLILKSRSGGEHWEGILNQTSEHPILKGWVDFLLDFSDEEFQYESYSKNKKYYQKSRSVYQSLYQHPNPEKFRQYADLTMQILDKENFLDENLGLFQRAFLCIGDYGFILSNNWFYGNYIPHGIFRDREALNWILSGVKNEKEMPYFKEFLDRLLKSPKANLQDKMQEIIDHCDLSNKEWWDQLLIIQKELFEFVNAKKKESAQKYRRIYKEWKKGKEGSIIELLHKSRRIDPGRNLLHYGFYNYCNENKEKYDLSISEYNDEGKRNFFTLNGKELFCDDAGTETKESKITFDGSNYLIVLKNVNIFDEFERILGEIAALLIKNNS